MKRFIASVIGTAIAAAAADYAALAAPADPDKAGYAAHWPRAKQTAPAPERAKELAL